MSKPLVYVRLYVGSGDGGAGEDEEALDDVAELSDVSCPGLVNEEFHRLRLDLARLHAGLLTDLSHEMVYQKRDVLLTLIQRRSSLNVPLAISSLRFLLVAATTRTSTTISLSLPTLESFFSCRTLSTLA